MIVISLLRASDHSRYAFAICTYLAHRLQTGVQFNPRDTSDDVLQAQRPRRTCLRRHRRGAWASPSSAAPSSSSPFRLTRRRQRAAQVSGEFERPFGFSYGQEQSSYNASTRDANGNRIILDGRIMTGMDQSSLSTASASAGAWAQATAGAGSAAARDSGQAHRQPAQRHHPGQLEHGDRELHPDQQRQPDDRPERKDRSPMSKRMKLRRRCCAARLRSRAASRPTPARTASTRSPIGNAPVTANPTPYSTALVCLANYARGHQQGRSRASPWAASLDYTGKEDLEGGRKRHAGRVADGDVGLRQGRRAPGRALRHVGVGTRAANTPTTS